MGLISIARDIEGLMPIFAEEATFRIVGLGEAVKGREAIRATLHDLVARFAFLEWEQLAVLVCGDQIAVRSRLKFKHHPNEQVAETETAEFFTMQRAVRPDGIVWQLRIRAIPIR